MYTDCSKFVSNPQLICILFSFHFECFSLYIYILLSMHCDSQSTHTMPVFYMFWNLTHIWCSIYSWPSHMRFRFPDICDTDSYQCYCPMSVWIPIVNMSLLIHTCTVGSLGFDPYATYSWVYPIWIGAKSCLNLILWVISSLFDTYTIKFVMPFWCNLIHLMFSVLARSLRFLWGFPYSSKGEEHVIS